MMRILLLMLCVCCCAAPADAASYGIARSPAPVLNTPEIDSVFGGGDGRTLKTDRCGQVRELEFIALPGTVFRIHGESRTGSATVYRVESDDYPAAAKPPLYVDSRFIELRGERPSPRARSLPPAAEIVSALREAIGSSYVWGGNLRDGVPGLREIYYGGGAGAAVERRLSLAGLDCSGLLYQATGGWTPRNTSHLVSYGRAVPIAGKTADAIGRMLEPLDLIVWNGHVLIVLDRETIVESRLECGKPGNGGVVATALHRRLAGVMRTRRPVDSWPGSGKQRDVFVVRRWGSP